MKLRNILLLIVLLGLFGYIGFSQWENPTLTSARQEPLKEEAAPIKKETPTNLVRLAVEEYPPFTSEKLPGKGLLSIVVKEAFELEGIESEITFYPGSRAYKQAQSGQSDGTYNWADREERHEQKYPASRSKGN